jgi:hypothetical protein
MRCPDEAGNGLALEALFPSFSLCLIALLRPLPASLFVFLPGFALRLGPLPFGLAAVLLSLPDCFPPIFVPLPHRFGAVFPTVSVTVESGVLIAKVSRVIVPIDRVAVRVRDAALIAVVARAPRRASSKDDLNPALALQIASRLGVSGDREDRHSSDDQIQHSSHGYLLFASGRREFRVPVIGNLYFAIRYPLLKPMKTSGIRVAEAGSERLRAAIRWLD